MAFGALKGTLSGDGLSITTSNALSGSVVVAVGDLVFVAFAQETALTATTASDNLGNTYTATNAGTDSGTVTGRAYYSRVTVAGTLTAVTIVATSSANNFAGTVAIIEGPFKVAPLDKNIANLEDVASPFTCPATGVLTQADEVIMCWIAEAPRENVAATSPNLLADQRASNTVLSAAIGYQAVTATTSVSPAFTGTNMTDSVLGTSTFMKDLTVAVARSYGMVFG